MNKRLHVYMITVSFQMLLSMLFPASLNATECLTCHTASANEPIHAVLNSAHRQHQPHTPSATCHSCHGDSQAHARNPMKTPDVSFGPTWPASLATQSDRCQSCHADDHLFWEDSAHQSEGLHCTQCHTSHTQQDPVLSPKGQTVLCSRCHTDVKAAINTPYRHPLHEGKMSCDTCHNVHGSLTEASLNKPSLNETCLACHSEKRGPFLFEHAPVSEDCALCHRPHGSINDGMLNVRGPFLCQQCHSSAFHPSQLNDGSGVATGRANINLLGKNCLNCHSQIHGTNHPSGARLTR